MTDIMIFESDSHPVEVRLEGETVWLSQGQMAELFGTSTDNVSLHLKNIFTDKELDERATTEDFSIVRQEGTRQVKRLLARTLTNQQLVNDDGRAVLQVISDYARSWSLLQAYDEQSLTGQSAAQRGMRVLELDAVLPAIAQLKAELIAKGEATDLFGQLRGDGLASVIATTVLGRAQRRRLFCGCGRLSPRSRPGRRPRPHPPSPAAASPTPPAPQAGCRRA